MGLDFKLYEVTTYNDVEIRKEHTIEEVAYFSNSTAMIITNWFYRINGTHLKDTFDEMNHYVTVTGDKLYDIIKALNKVINTDTAKKDLLALHYFPAVYPVDDYVSSVEMFSEKYYNNLNELYNTLKKIMPNDTFLNQERLFFYNISW